MASELSAEEVERLDHAIHDVLTDAITAARGKAASDLKDDKRTKADQAKEVGRLLAEKAKTANVKTAVFDRGGYLYHGRVKALADAAREGGLAF